MTAHSSELDRVFILRLWRERGSEVPAPESWRARVIDVNTGKNFHTIGLEDAFNIVRQHLSAIGDQL